MGKCNPSSNTKDPTMSEKPKTRNLSFRARMLAVALAIELREQIEAGTLRYKEFEQILKRDPEYPKKERSFTSGIWRNNILKEANIVLTATNSSGPIWKHIETIEGNIEVLRQRIIDLEENATRGGK